MMGAAAAAIVRLRRSNSRKSRQSVENMVPIVGFGSLMSLRSCRSTFPIVKGFRLCKIYGYKRVFAHTSPFFFETGIANAESREIASCSAMKCKSAAGKGGMLCSLFYIPKTDLPAFYKRERGKIPDPMERFKLNFNFILQQ